MAAKTIALFSSDSTPLYRADIVRALSLPRDYLLPFRYPRSLIKPEPDELGNREGIIFYLHGNDLTKAESQRQLELYSICRARISAIARDTDTDYVRFYLALGDFIDCTLHPSTPTDSQPLRAFVSEVMINEGSNNTWQQRLDLVSSKLDIEKYLWVKRLMRGDTPVPLSVLGQDSYYELEEETQYRVFCASYSRGPANAGFATSDSITIEQPTLGGLVDIPSVNLSTRSIDRPWLPAWIRFAQDNKKGYEVDVKLRIIRKKYKPLKFGLLSALALGSILLGQAALKSYPDTALGVVVSLAALALVLAGTSAAVLFHVFNKK